MPAEADPSGKSRSGGAPARQTFVPVIDAGPDPGPFLRRMVRGTTG